MKTVKGQMQQSPKMKVYNLQIDYLMTTMSGQHTPPKHGNGPTPTPFNAKQGWFDDENNEKDPAFDVASEDIKF